MENGLKHLKSSGGFSPDSIEVMGAGRVGGHAEFSRWKATGGPRAWMDAQVLSPRGEGSRLGAGGGLRGNWKESRWTACILLGKEEKAGPRNYVKMKT